MSKAIERAIESLSELKDENVTVTERMTTDGYFISVKFSEKLPESAIEIVGTRPPKEALDNASMSLIDAPYFGVSFELLSGAKWAIEQMRNL